MDWFTPTGWQAFLPPDFSYACDQSEGGDGLLSYSDELRKHYKLYQLLLFHCQEKQVNHYFDLSKEQIDSFTHSFRRFSGRFWRIETGFECPNFALLGMQNWRLLTISSKSSSAMLLAFAPLKTSKNEFWLPTTSKKRRPIRSSRDLSCSSTHYSW